MGWTCSTYGERRGVYRGLVGNLEGWGPLERPRRRWVGNNEIYREVGCVGMNWLDVAQDKVRWWTLVNAVMNFRVS